MAGRRPLSHSEQVNLLKVARKLKPRDRALITCQLMCGYLIGEVLSLTIGSVLRNERLVEKIGVAPRNLKDGYGRTRWVPLLPELLRALESYLGWLGRRLILSPDMPLFLSRESTPDPARRRVPGDERNPFYIGGWGGFAKILKKRR
jgi:integrase